MAWGVLVCVEKLIILSLIITLRAESVVQCLELFGQSEQLKVQIGAPHHLYLLRQLYQPGVVFSIPLCSHHLHVATGRLLNKRLTSSIIQEILKYIKLLRFDENNINEEKDNNFKKLLKIRQVVYCV